MRARARERTLAPHGVGGGAAYPLSGGAASKAILSALDDERVDGLLAGVPPGPVARRFRDDVAKARRLGYATSVGETVDGAAAVSTPIVRSTGEVIGALNLTGPVVRMPDSALAEYGTALIAAANEIMTQFGRTTAPDVGRSKGAARGRR